MKHHSITLTFRPIDPDTDQKIWLELARDLIGILENNPDHFNQKYGAEGEMYFEKQIPKVRENPALNVLVFDGNKPVGMLLMSIYPEEPTEGYINQVYLISDYRNKGLGEQVQAHAFKIFQDLGLVKAKLTAAPDNKPTWRFYEKHGWKDLGPRSDIPGRRFLGKEL